MSGRPSVITISSVQKLEGAFKNGFSVLKACELSGISRSTYYKWLDEDAEFSDKMALAQAWATEAARMVIVRAIYKGDTKTAQWWLERKAKSEFYLPDIQSSDEKVPEHSSLKYIKEIAEAVSFASKEK